MNTKFHTLLFLFLLSLSHQLQASTTLTANPSTLLSVYEAAKNGDVILLDAGYYSTDITFPTGKNITLKANSAIESQPIITFQLNPPIGDGGSLILDGLEINRNADYFFNSTAGNFNMTLLRFVNCSILNIKKTLYQSAANNGHFGELSFDNCILSNCGSSKTSFIFVSQTVENFSIRNSTIYNYTGGDFFKAGNTTTTRNINVDFVNNTMYKCIWDKGYGWISINYAYPTGNSYLFRNNIFDSGANTNPSTNQPLLVYRGNGDVKEEKNIKINYQGNNSTITLDSNLKLGTTPLEEYTAIPYTNANNGNFSIPNTSPFSNAGVNDSFVGDPRWIRIINDPVTLSSRVSPSAAGTTYPTSLTVNRNENTILSATANFGYRFIRWEDNLGNVLSTNSTYSFQLTNDLMAIAIFETLTTRSLNVNIEGTGKRWGEVALSPSSTGGEFLDQSIVTASITGNRVAPFLYWEDGSSNSSRQLLMDNDKSITATFDQIPFIVAWNFNYARNGARNNRQGDFYSDTQNIGLLKLYEPNGSENNWGSNSRNFGGITYECARRYTSGAVIAGGETRSFVASFKTLGYKDIRIECKVGADNTCVNSIQKMQYSTDGVTYTDCATIDLTGKSNQWIEINVALPEALNNLERIYIRWIGDATTSALGSYTEEETEGFYLTEVYVLGDEIPVIDNDSPLLLSTSPTTQSTIASASGKIVLTFNEKVKAGHGSCELNGTALTPIFGSNTVSFAYSDLSYGASNSFVVPKGVFQDMSGNVFEGIVLTFLTMNRPQPIARLFDAVVAKDGSGDYTTIQAMVDAMPSNRTTPWLVLVKNGVYEELVRVSSEKTFLHLIGQDREKVIITYKVYASDSRVPEDTEDYSGASGHQDGGIMVFKAYANDFYAENISFINRWGVEKLTGPMALAISSYNDRMSLYNCKLRSYQDTWQTTNTDNNRHFAFNCFVEGGVDYIYSGGNVWIEQSTLYNNRAGSVIVAPAHANTKYGYVFQDCKIDGNSASAASQNVLGRPWQNSPKVAWINTKALVPISAEGWSTMGGLPEIFAEYRTVDKNGDLLDLSGRRKIFTKMIDGVEVSKEAKSILSDEDVVGYTYENVVMSEDKWNPRSFFEKVEKPTALSATNNTLSWKPVNYAICYIIYAENEIIGFSKTTQFSVANPQSNKMYRVCAVNEFGSLGELSDEKVQLLPTGVCQQIETSVRISVLNEWLHICGLFNGDLVTLYSIDGTAQDKFIASSSEMTIQLKQKQGIFFVKVNDLAIKKFAF